MAMACVVVLVVLATALPGPVEMCWVTGLPACVPEWEVAAKPPTTATAKRAPTTATPATRIAVPPALKPSWRTGRRRLTELPTSSRLEANGSPVASLAWRFFRKGYLPLLPGATNCRSSTYGANHTTARGGRTISAE